MPLDLSIDDRELAKQAMRRFSRQMLGLGELISEIEQLEQQLDLIKTFPDSAGRAEALAYYEHDLDETTDRLNRLTAAGRGFRGPAWARPDFESARLADIVGLAESLGYAPRRSGMYFVMPCPFHEGDREPSLTIYPPGQGWHCFGCHKGGQDAASFAAEHFQCSQVEGLRWVQEMAYGIKGQSGDSTL